MLRAEIEVESRSVVMDISEICNARVQDQLLVIKISICLHENLWGYLAFTGADTHMSIFSVEGVHEQPQALKRTESLKCLFVLVHFDLSCQGSECHKSHLNLQIHRTMADLGGELPLPLRGDFGAGAADLLVDRGRLRRLTQLLSDTGLQGVLTHEQGRLQFLSQQEVMFGFLHLREQRKPSLSVTAFGNKRKMYLCVSSLTVFPVTKP